MISWTDLPSLIIAAILPRRSVVAFSFRWTSAFVSRSPCPGTYVSALSPTSPFTFVSQPAVEPFFDAIESLITVVSPGYLNEGKRFATIAIGCTGGKHRSVAIAEELARRLRIHGVKSLVVHRDLGHE